MRALLNAHDISDNAEGSTKLRSSPLNFTYDQYIHYARGTIYTNAPEGLVWTSTVGDATQATQLDIVSSRVYLKDNPRAYGFSVRGLVRKDSNA